MVAGTGVASPGNGLGNGRASIAGGMANGSGGQADARSGQDSATVPVPASGGSVGMDVADGKVGSAKWQPSDSIHIRMMRAQADVRTLAQDADVEIKKEGKTVGKYKGVTAAQIVTNAKSVLLDYGILYLPMQSKADVKILGNKTAIWVDGHFINVNDKNDFFVLGAWGAGTDNGDKDYAKAFTNANKQILSKALQMSTVEDQKDDEETVAHEPDHKPKAVKNAEAMTDVAVKTWADAYKAALDGCRTLKDLKRIRSENAHMMNNPGVPQITKDYFIDKVTSLEGALE